MSYFFKLIPVVAITTLVILSLPWLGLIALMVVVAALAPLAAALIYLPYRLGRAIIHWQRAPADTHTYGPRYAYGHATESIGAPERDASLSYTSHWKE